MDTKLAINILDNTFKEKCDIERFEYFLRYSVSFLAP